MHPACARGTLPAMRALPPTTSPGRRFTHPDSRVSSANRRLISPALRPSLIPGLLAACGLLAGIGGLSACGTITSLRGTSGALVSSEQPHSLKPSIKARLFDSTDDLNSADIVLSDLPAETLADADAWQHATGQIIHARMFVKPRPGRTPIENTACSVTIRYLVLAGDGVYGLYAGGGFLIPDGSPDGDTFSGEIHNANLRLVSASPGFKDLIGTGRLDLNFRARRDPDAVARATRNADFLAFAALPVEDHPLLISED